MGKRAWRTQIKAQPVTIRHADGTSATVAPESLLKTPYWRSDAWRRRRRARLAYDNHQCVSCKRQHGDTDPRLKGNRTTRLEVHHLTYARFGYERLEDLLTLCQRCHATEHQWQRRRASALKAGCGR